MVNGDHYLKGYVCSIIYRIHIISIANMSDGLMVSNILSLLNTYQIVNDNSVMFNRNVHLYCHLYKVPTTPCAQDIILNHFDYLEVVEELPTDYNRQIYYCDSRDNDYSVKMKYSSGPSSSGDIFSLTVTIR